MSSVVRKDDEVRIQRLVRWARRVRLGRRLAIALAILSVVCGVATYAILTGATFLRPEQGVFRGLLWFDLALALSLGAVVARRLVWLWSARRRGSAGSRLHTRFVTLFSMVAVMPAILVGGFTVFFFDIGLQGWFSQRVRTAIGASVAVAEAYIEEHRQNIRADVLAMAIDLNRLARRLERNATRFNQLVSTQAALRSLSEAVVFDSSGRVLARSTLSFVMEFDKVPDDAMERAQQGEIVVLTGGHDDRVRALVRLENFLDAYLYVGRFVAPKVIGHLQRARRARADYEALQERRSGIEIGFALTFAMVTVLLLLAAIWLGLVFATHLAERIGGIATAAGRVRDGDLTVRVDEDGDDDLGALGIAFNRMTSQLESQRTELLQANLQLDERRRFMETVLSGVTAGVIGLDRKGRIDLPNRSATQQLGATRESLIGKPFAATVPEMARLLEEARRRPNRIARAQVNITRDGRTRNLMVRLASEVADGEIRGHVVTFDDVTELVSAQRTAAWADVARRIAHEIKNPLTPIQLSAERLKRKYLGEIETEPEVFSQCTDTIIRQVGDIGRMVDEFTSFARMPAPVFKQESLSELVVQAVFLQRVAHPEIEYVTHDENALPSVRCDRSQIAQALTNLLKNAAEAIEAAQAAAGEAAVSGRIEVALREQADAIVVDVVDNGTGLPEADRERLAEPYVTNRAKGTGLGLAIVRKVMEEHGGGLALDDAPGSGACIRLLFPHPSTAADEPDPADAADDPGNRLVSHGS